MITIYLKNSGWFADLLQFSLCDNAHVVYITSPDVPLSSTLDIKGLKLREMGVAPHNMLAKGSEKERERERKRERGGEKELRNDLT